MAGVSASVDGIPGIEAYRAAKAGNLWFSEEGILWGESKPCEFWALKDLFGKDDGIKVVSTGRTCTVVLTRRSPNRGEAAGESECEDIGEETEFGMVDGREREPINAWVRNHRHSFGMNGLSDKKGKGKEVVKSKSLPAGPMTIQDLPDESDDDDEEFEVDGVSDLDGSEGTSDESSPDPGSDDEDEDRGDIKGGDDNDSDSDLNDADRPLLRAGALPRMSKGVCEMVVGLVKEAFIGPPGVNEDEDEEDELDDDYLASG